MADLLEPGAPFHGTYTIVRLIGRGGIGEVYEAKHDFLGRRVAIKCVRLKSNLSKTAAQRMAKEAQALCALDHPNIIRIYDAGLSGEFVFMVTELLDGGTLRDKLEAERRVLLLPALRYHLEWADALVQVHAAGIIHRDLKPENVFITKGGLSKLLDFGAALDSQRITVVGHTVGTPAYMAPEHLTGDLEIDPRADIYPMGIMLYESLTGQHPFVLPSDQELPDHFEFARRHLFEAWPKLSQVLPGTPPAIEAIVDRCLAKNRDDRFPTAALLREALRGALEEVNKPAAMPLIQRAPDAVSKTKPMPRQTAMRLDIGMTTRFGKMTERMTPAPAMGRAAAALADTAPLAASMVARSAPTLEDQAQFQRGMTPAPPSPGMAVAMSPKSAQPVMPSRAPAAIAILSIGALTLIGVFWFLMRSDAAPSSGSGNMATASAQVSAPPVASAPVTPPPQASTPAAESPPPPPTESATPSAVASTSAAPAAVETATPKPISRPIVRPRQVQTSKPAGPVPIFER